MYFAPGGGPRVARFADLLLSLNFSLMPVP